MTLKPLQDCTSLAVSHSGALDNDVAMKRAALLFDRVLLWSMSFGRPTVPNPHFIQYDLLADNGIIQGIGVSLPFSIPSIGGLDVNKGLMPRGDEFQIDALDAAKFTQDIGGITGPPDRIVRSAAAYLWGRLGIKAVALTGRVPEPEGTDATSNVASVVLRHLPAPTALTPWEALFDFRSDSETEEKFAAIKEWMSRAAVADKDRDALNDEICDLVAAYERHMKCALTHIVTDSIVEATFVAVSAAAVPAPVLVAALGAAKAMYTVTQSFIRLRDAERSVPGYEVAYTLHAHEQLPGSRAAS